MKFLEAIGFSLGLGALLTAPAWALDVWLWLRNRR